MWKWDDALHYTPDQVSRIVSAQEMKPKEIIEITDDTITIQGSGKEPYVATLEDCTCQDFMFRLKKDAPCKHIYRLAMEKGLIKLPELSDELYNPKEELKKLEDMYRNGRISAKNYAEIGKLLKKLR